MLGKEMEQRNNAPLEGEESGKVIMIDCILKIACIYIQTAIHHLEVRLLCVYSQQHQSIHSAGMIGWLIICVCVSAICWLLFCLVLFVSVVSVVCQVVVVFTSDH